jgi:hypothetical protein
LVNQKFEPEAKGRLEPVSLDAWNKTFTTGIPDFEKLNHEE